VRCFYSVYALVALLATPAAAQIGNPAGVEPGTPQTSPGVPAPHYPNTQDRLFARLAAAGGMAEVDLGRLAQQKAHAAEVKEFGRTMVRDHGALNKAVVELAGRLNVTHATPSAPGAMTATEGKTGADFDRAYIDNEVTMHQDVLGKLDRDLIPAATNAELRTLLQQARGNIQAHLDRARQLQGTLGKAN